MTRHPRLEGYAAVFWAIGKQPKQDFYQRIAPGAFAESIRTDEILALWKHDLALELGDVLSLKENSRGLTFEIQPFEGRRWIDSAIAEIRDGTVRGMSTGYRILEYRDDLLARGLVRTVLRADLLEISPVCFPNVLETRVHLVERAVAEPLPREDVIRIEPALVGRPRRHIRAGMVVYC